MNLIHIKINISEQPDSHEKGRRKLEFNKEKKLQKERLKGFIVFVDVPNASAKQKEIKEKVTNLGGVFFVIFKIIFHKILIM